MRRRFLVCVALLAIGSFLVATTEAQKKSRNQSRSVAKSSNVATIEPASVGDQKIWVQIYGARVFKLHIDPREPEVIYATTPVGLYKTTDKGFRWKFVFAPPFPDPGYPLWNGGPAASLIFSQSKNSPNIMFLGANWGENGDRWPTIWKSENGGETWNDASAGVIVGNANPGHFISNIVISPNDPLIVHLIFRDGPSSNTYKTLNGGKSWGTVNGVDLGADGADTQQPLLFRRNANAFKGYDLSEDGGSTWSNIPIPDTHDVMECVGFSPKADQVIYAGSQKAIYVSANRGKSWKKVFDSGAWSLAVAGPDTVYAATSKGIWKTLNGGNTWHSANFMLPMPIRRSDGGISFDRLCWVDDATDTIYVGGRGGYWTTTDGGFNWQWNSIGNSNAQVMNIKITSDRTMFVVAYDRDTWSSGKLLFRISPQGKRDNLGNFDSQKIPDGWPESLTGISESDSRVIYRGARISEDSAFSWRQMNVTLDAGHSKIIVSPVSPKIAYVVVWGDSGGVLATTDGGNTWKRLSMTFVPLDLVPDPTEAMTVYTINLTKLYRSRNGGEHWDAIVDLSPLGLADDYPRDSSGAAVSPSKFAVNPLDTNTFYLKSRKGFWESRNSGRSWHLYDRGFNRDGVGRFVVSGTKILAQGSNGIYRLSDQNLSWAVEKWDQYEK